MKFLLLFLFSLLSLVGSGQNFDVRVSHFTNTCSGQTHNDLREPQMRWNLSAQKVEYYVVSNYDSSQRESWLLFNVKDFKVENDTVNGIAYIYTVTSYKHGNGTLIYVPQEKFVRLTINGKDCGQVYTLY